MAYNSRRQGCDSGEDSGLHGDMLDEEETRYWDNEVNLSRDLLLNHGIRSAVIYPQPVPDERGHRVLMSPSFTSLNVPFLPKAIQKETLKLRTFVG